MPRHQEVVQNVGSFFSEKLVQISLVSGVLFYIVANSATFSFVEKLLKQVLGVVGICHINGIRCQVCIYPFNGCHEKRNRSRFIP